LPVDLEHRDDEHDQQEKAEQGAGCVFSNCFGDVLHAQSLPLYLQPVIPWDFHLRCFFIHLLAIRTALSALRLVLIVIKIQSKPPVALGRVV
jgi:hypothetical protein